MRIKKSFLVLLIALAVVQLESITVHAQTDNTYQILSKGFLNPPSNGYPSVYHWWLGGNVDTVRLKEELFSFKKAGISGFTIFEIGSRDTACQPANPELFRTVRPYRRFAGNQPKVSLQKLPPDNFC